MNNHLKTEYTSNQENTERRKRSLKNPISYYFIAGLSGIFATLLLLTFLFTNNIYPFHDQNEKVAFAEVEKDPFQAWIDDDGIPTNIEELSKAIVGVTHLQKRDIWGAEDKAGSGSGIIYKEGNGKAYIVTNNHVVEGANEVEIELEDGKQEKAKILGRDQLTDLAVLEIDSDHVNYVAQLGNSDDLKLGESVLAIGNPLSLDFAGTVTKGIISGLNRALKVDTSGDGNPDWITEVIQTDAAINPGNSGGALVNAKGEVIGINSMKIAQHTVEGIGFAIPIDTALPIMEQLETDGKVSRPYIGISVAELNQVPMQFRDQIVLPENEEGGIVIASVEDHSPAAKVNLQQFDVITKINDQQIESLIDLRKYMYSELTMDDAIKVEYYRNGEKNSVQLQLAEES